MSQHVPLDWVLVQHFSDQRLSWWLQIAVNIYLKLFHRVKILWIADISDNETQIGVTALAWGKIVKKKISDNTGLVYKSCAYLKSLSLKEKRKKTTIIVYAWPKLNPCFSLRSPHPQHSSSQASSDFQTKKGLNKESHYGRVSSDVSIKKYIIAYVYLKSSQINIEQSSHKIYLRGWNWLFVPQKYAI